MKDYLCTIVKPPTSWGSFDLGILMVTFGFGSSMFLRIASSGEDINGAVSSSFGISLRKEVTQSSNKLTFNVGWVLVLQCFISHYNTEL